MRRGHDGGTGIECFRGAGAVEDRGAVGRGRCNYCGEDGRGEGGRTSSGVACIIAVRGGARWHGDAGGGGRSDPVHNGGDIDVGYSGDYAAAAGAGAARDAAAGCIDAAADSRDGADARHWADAAHSVRGCGRGGRFEAEDLCELISRADQESELRSWGSGGERNSRRTEIVPYCHWNQVSWVFRKLSDSENLA